MREGLVLLVYESLLDHGYGFWFFACDGFFGWSFGLYFLVLVLGVGFGSDAGLVKIGSGDDFAKGPSQGWAGS